MLKFLKRLLFWILALIALVLVVALFLPTKFNVKRSAVISQPKDSISTECPAASMRPLEQASIQDRYRSS